jgi:hypothetical protein
VAGQTDLMELSVLVTLGTGGENQRVAIRVSNHAPHHVVGEVPDPPSPAAADRLDSHVELAGGVIDIRRQTAAGDRRPSGGRAPA